MSSPGHGLPYFFSSCHSYVLPLHKFLVLRSVVASFCTSSFHLFFGFPTVPSFSETSFQNSFCYFVLEHPWYMPSPLYNLNVRIRYPVCVCTQSVQCFIAPYFPDAILSYWSRYSKKYFSFKRTYYLWDYRKTTAFHSQTENLFGYVFCEE